MTTDHAVVLGAALEILIPLYSYPTWWQPQSYVWDDVAAANAAVPITAIVDPANGPGGGGPNADYLVGLADLRSGGVTMLGYAYTSYGARPAADVKADIDVWSDQWTAYGVSGIFLDEAAPGSATLDYYEDLYHYVLSKPGLTRVVVNPGTTADEGYLSRPAASVVVGFENTATAWEAYVPPAYQSSYAPSHFSALVHTVPDAAVMQHAVDLAARRRFGYVFVTDDTMPNPWDTLPAFWTAEVSYVAALDAAVGVAEPEARSSWGRTKSAYR